MPPVFRRLEIGDAAAMAALEHKCFSLPWTLVQCEGAFGQKAFAAFGLWTEKELDAYISVYHAAGEMEILNLAVREERRRQGFGMRLLRMVLQVAHKMGIQKVSLEVRHGNLPAIALYESAGFCQQGRRKRYYPDTGEDALLYVFNFLIIPDFGRDSPKDLLCRK